MPIAISLLGHVPLSPDRLTRSAARDWLARAAVWFEALGDCVLDTDLVRDSDDKPVLLASFHPAATPLELRLGGTGRVRANAITTPAGPGYHIHLCERLRQFAKEFDVTWDEDACQDPTGYFTTTDRQTCETHFLQWLGMVCGAAKEHAGRDPVFIGLPTSLGFTGPGEVLTPLGPRRRAWLAEIDANPEAGRDFFPWWKPDPDAEFYSNRALVRMWCEFPWRPPLTEDEGELTDQIANDLATAYKLDPASELPWRKWLEVLDAIENDDDGHTVNPADEALQEAVTQRAFESAPAPPIGYLRQPVRRILSNGWSIEVPGASPMSGTKSTRGPRGTPPAPCGSTPWASRSRTVRTPPRRKPWPWAAAVCRRVRRCRPSTATACVAKRCTAKRKKTAEKCGGSAASPPPASISWSATSTRIRPPTARGPRRRGTR